MADKLEKENESPDKPPPYSGNSVKFPRDRFQPAIMDTTETVGVPMTSINNLKPTSNQNVEYDDFDAEHFTFGFHPCICCNVNLRAGIQILAMIEIVHWGILLIFCIASLLYWLLAKNPTTTNGDQTISRQNGSLIRNVLIAYVCFCVAFLTLGIILFIGAKKRKRYFVMSWSIGTLGVEVLRMVFVILVPMDAVRYGLLYWLFRAYEFWAVVSYTHKLRKQNKDTQERSKFSRWRKKKKAHSSITALIPVTYYGFYDDEENGDYGIEGYQLQGFDDYGTSHSPPPKSSKTQDNSEG